MEAITSAGWTRFKPIKGQPIAEKDMKKVFRMVDLDKSGAISNLELKMAVKYLGKRYGISDVWMIGRKQLKPLFCRLKLGGRQWKKRMEITMESLLTWSFRMQLNLQRKKWRKWNKKSNSNKIIKCNFWHQKNGADFAKRTFSENS